MYPTCPALPARVVTTPPEVIFLIVEFLRVRHIQISDTIHPRNAFRIVEPGAGAGIIGSCPCFADIPPASSPLRTR